MMETAKATVYRIEFRTLDNWYLWMVVTDEHDAHTEYDYLRNKFPLTQWRVMKDGRVVNW